MILIDVFVDRNISQIEPNEQSTKDNGQKIKEIDSTEHKEKKNMESLLEMLKILKKLVESEDENSLKEWQTIATVLDKLIFILNVISFIIAFGYWYITLYT